MLKQLTFLMLGLLFLVSACSQKKDDSENLALHHYGLLSDGRCYDYTVNNYADPVHCTTNSNYYLSNGLCYSRLTGQRADQHLCNSVQNNNGYYMINNVCHAPNGQQVNAAYCMNGSSTTGGQCYGQYIWTNQYGQAQIVPCSGANCRGYTLIEQSTGRQVYCQ